MMRAPCVAIIIENMDGDFLLLLRDDKPDISFPNHWTLVGGRVEPGEIPEAAAHRELEEETGLKAALIFWKRFDRQHPRAIVDQYIYLAKVHSSIEDIVLGEGQDVRYFKPDEIKNLKIGFEFDALLQEYFRIQNHPE
jgi:8-oxo-dGTP diphosphatase